MLPGIDLADVLDEAFVDKFLKRTRPGRWGCIEWCGARNRGYGVLVLTKDGRSRSLVAHRVAWVIHHRALIPPELVIDHLCCNKGCVNPDHLEAITDVENFHRIKKPPRGWVSVRNPKYPRRRRQKIAAAVSDGQAV